MPKKYQPRGPLPWVFSLKSHTNLTAEVPVSVVQMGTPRLGEALPQDREAGRVETSKARAPSTGHSSCVPARGSSCSISRSLESSAVILLLEPIVPVWDLPESPDSRQRHRKRSHRWVASVMWLHSVPRAPDSWLLLQP